MNTDIITRKAIEEIQNPAFGVTQQFLEVHNIKLRDGVPVINRVYLEDEALGSVVYFEVEGERFYFAVYLDVEPEVRVRHTNTADSFHVYLSAGFNELHSDEIIAMTSLKATRYWNKGDKTTTGGKKTFTKVMFEPNREADDFNDKLRKLLDYLEQDVTGVKRLVTEANGYIQVAAKFHNGNTMLGGFYLDTNTMQRLTALGLGVDFDLYAEGNFFR